MSVLVDVRSRESWLDHGDANPKAFLANPDQPARLCTDAPLNTPTPGLAKRLETCLVVGKDNSVYYSPDGREAYASQIPGGGLIVYGKLNACIPLEEDEELRARAKLLAGYEQHHRVAGYLFGDLTKGGRDASQEELLRLGGRQTNGIPVGLAQCFTGGE